MADPRETGSHHRKGIRKESIVPNPFTVQVRDVATTYRWIKFLDEASNQTFLAPSDDQSSKETLPLGKLELRDNVLYGLQAAMLYHPDSSVYEVSTNFVFNGDPVAISISGEGIKDMGDIFRRMQEASQVQAPDPIDLNKVGKRLNKSPFAEKYHVSYTQPNHHQSDQLTLTPYDSNKTEELVFHRIDDPQIPYPIYCLHSIKETGDLTQEAMQTQHEHLAHATQEITHVIYQLKGEPTPTDVFTIAPHKNTNIKLDQLQQRIKVQKRMLSATGMIDGDEELVEEIQSKILLETRPDITFADIGGNEGAKEELETVVDALQDPDKYTRWGTQAPRGILLYGPPGTGKTLLAKALAHESDAQIMVVNTADVLHSLYGRTERLVQAVFDEAQKHAPVVILFDELDALAGSRKNSSEVTSRIVSVLLQNLQGLEERGNGVIAVGTTNRLDAIDTALLRPGRFDLLVEVSLPEDTQRVDIFTIHMRNAANLAGERVIFDPSINFSQLIESTKGFSGADIEEVIRRTLARKVRQETKGQRPGPATTEDLIGTIKSYEKIRKAKQQRLGFALSSS